MVWKIFKLLFTAVLVSRDPGVASEMVIVQNVDLACLSQANRAPEFERAGPDGWSSYGKRVVWFWNSV